MRDASTQRAPTPRLGKPRTPQGRSSVRAWLYQITRNASLRLIARRPRRILSPDHGPPWRNTGDLGNPVPGPIWVEPSPDDEPAGEPGEVDPAALYRKAVRQRVPEKTQQAELDALGRNGSRNLVDAFMRAWERADVATLVDLLGQGEIGRFFADQMFTRPWRLVPLRANGQPGFAGYRGGHGGDRFRLAGINVLSVRTGRIAWIASFLDPDVHRHFGLPAELRPGDFPR
jgi:hypothetical protein